MAAACIIPTALGDGRGDPAGSWNSESLVYSCLIVLLTLWSSHNVLFFFFVYVAEAWSVEMALLYRRPFSSRASATFFSSFPFLFLSSSVMGWVEVQCLCWIRS